MMLYGDPQFTVRLSVLLQHLAHRLASTDAASLDSLRALVIQMGQLEQAWFDFAAQTATEPGANRCVLALTEFAAAAFCRCHRRQPADISHILGALRAELVRLNAAGDVALTVKIPEGFEFYALYPEQYILALHRWLQRQHDTNARQVLVVGIRSIGTTLSAVLGAELSLEGWQTRRLTARPGGPPFARSVKLEEANPTRAARVIVVDEGPGLSGSTMAAVAAELVAQGYEPEQLAFFPGHAGEPGRESTEIVRRWWRRVERFVVPGEAIRWNERSLPESLRQRTAELSGSSYGSVSIQALGGGSWRGLLYRRKRDWPAVAVPFERLKYRCLAENGEAVFWKFAGLGALLDDGRTQMERGLEQMRLRAKAGWSPLPSGVRQGFIATPWIEGCSLTQGQCLRRDTIRLCGRYIAELAGPALSKDEQAGALERLAGMLRHNVQELFGGALAGRAADLGRRLRVPFPLAGCQDGRMSRAHWLQCSDGGLWKTSGSVAGVEHTLLSLQTVLWDIAAVTAGWRLSAPLRACLIRSLCRAGLRVDESALRSHEAAYLAFQLGKMASCLSLPEGEAEEHSRLSRAYRCRRRQLQRLLQLE